MIMIHKLLINITNVTAHHTVLFIEILITQCTQCKYRYACRQWQADGKQAGTYGHTHT